jgi:glycerate 2-kinase
MAAQTDRSRLRRLYRAALTGADAEAAVRRTLADPAVGSALAKARRVGVFASGKAAAAMLAGAREVSGPRLAVVPQGGVRPRARGGLEVLAAAHPEPDVSSVRAARRAAAFFSEFDDGDAILCLVSGGTSSLLCLPRPGLSLSEKRRKIALLVRRGEPIAEVNRLRASLSAVKGGRLGRITRARLVTLVLSDVQGDRAALVGSGPTVRRRRGDVVRVVASNASGLSAAAGEARSMGLSPRLATPLWGEAREAGARFARAALLLTPGEALLAGGETTVELPGRSGRSGRGGRCLELALGAAGILADQGEVAILAAGSDGRDGSSSAAGAFADGTTLSRARRQGLNPLATLARHDTHPFFERIRDLFVTGPTGGNVADWAFAVRRREPGSQL